MEASGWWDFFTAWLASPRASIPRELVDTACSLLTMLRSHAASLLLHSVAQSSHRPTPFKGNRPFLSMGGQQRIQGHIFKLPHVLFQALTCTHKLSFSVDVLHICKVLTNTRARLWVTGSLELINSPRWCLNLLMRIFCFVKLFLIPSIRKQPLLILSLHSLPLIHTLSGPLQRDLETLTMFYSSFWFI